MSSHWGPALGKPTPDGPKPQETTSVADIGVVPASLPGGQNDDSRPTLLRETLARAGTRRTVVPGSPAIPVRHFAKASYSALVLFLGLQVANAAPIDPSSEIVLGMSAALSGGTADLGHNMMLG